MQAINVCQTQSPDPFSNLDNVEQQAGKQVGMGDGLQVDDIGRGARAHSGSSSSSRIGTERAGPMPSRPVPPVRRKGVAGYYRVGEGQEIVFEGGAEQQEELQRLMCREAAWLKDELGEQGKHFFHGGTSNMLGGPGPGCRPPRGARGPAVGIVKHMRPPVDTAAGYWDEQPGKQLSWQQPMFKDDTGCHLVHFEPEHITQFVQLEPAMRRVLGEGGKLSQSTFPGCTKDSSPQELVGCLLDLLAPAMHLPSCGDSCQGWPQDRELFNYIPIRGSAAATSSGAASSSAAAAAPKRPCQICWPWDHEYVSRTPCLHSIPKQQECCYLRIYVGQAPAVPKEGVRHSSRLKQKFEGQQQQQEAEKQQQQQQQQDHADGGKDAGDDGRVEQGQGEPGERGMTSNSNSNALQPIIPVYVSAHRLMCWLMRGPPPSANHEVSFECRHTWCLALAHMRWKTHKENMRACMEKSKQQCLTALLRLPHLSFLFVCLI